MLFLLSSARGQPKPKHATRIGICTNMLRHATHMLYFALSDGARAAITRIKAHTHILMLFYVVMVLVVYACYVSFSGRLRVHASLHSYVKYNVRRARYLIVNERERDRVRWSSGYYRHVRPVHSSACWAMQVYRNLCIRCTCPKLQTTPTRFLWKESNACLWRVREQSRI